MPIVTVSHKDAAPGDLLDVLRTSLPAIVSEALACAEEPYDGRLQPGDVNLRFLGALSEREELDYLVEIRTRWTDSRAADLDERAARIRAELASLGLERFGVWIEAPAAGWAQS